MGPSTTTRRRYLAYERQGDQRIILTFRSREARDRWVSTGELRKPVVRRELSAGELRIIDRQLELPI